MGLSRRKFLIATGLVGGGIAIGFSFSDKPKVPYTREGSFQPNSWLQITDAGEVIFQLDKSEMGQGVMTTLTTIIAEELDYNPANITVEQAGLHPDFVNELMALHLTGASSSTMDSYMTLREAGAAARAMLLAAAAQQWSVAADSCETNDGVVTHFSGKSMTYGELVPAAKALKGDVAFQIKDENSFKWIGKSVARLDVPEKTDGTATFGVDVDMPGLKVAVVKRCPQFGGSLIGYDDSKAKTMDGVLKIFPIHSGVAVVAETYWQARKAADALDINWDKGPLAGLNSDQIRANQEKSLKEKEAVYQVDDGDTAGALSSLSNVLEATYSAPYTHHSPMEPQNTTAIARGDTIEVWSPSQGPQIAQAVIAHYTGFKRENITVHTTLMGGGFGRRGYVDFAGEAGAVAKGYPNVPVKLMWSREDDMQHDYYRPATLHGVKAAIDESGKLVAWQHDLVSTSIIQGFGVDMAQALIPAWVPTEIARNFGQGFSDMIAEYDPTMAEGALIPYSVANAKIGCILYDPGITTGFWRSVGHSHNAFVVESFVDECAHAAGKDPADFRFGMLRDKPRHLAVLKKVLEMSNYGKSDMAIGIAVHESFKSFVAQAVEVSVEGDKFTVSKVYCAADCGLVINPDIVKAQMESGIIYGLSAALKAPITFEDGKTKQSNFHDLPVLRMNESPDIEVELISSFEPPTGVGEIAVPPIAPAVANALFAKTGQRLRDLPLKLSADATA